MKRTAFLLVLGAAILALGAAALTVTVVLHRDTTLEFQVRDSVSERWVWDLTMKIQGREAKGYYQSDAGLTSYRFTHLRPGAAVLDLSAPAYRGVTVPIVLRRGANRIDRPIEMTGTEIPGLTRFVIFESLDNTDIVAQLRPVGTDGKAVLNHPCLPIWVGARVSVETVGGLPARDEVDHGAGRGRTLFEGEIPWTWDPSPDSVFRYGARIPGARLADDPAPLRVIDYLVVLADPLQVTPAGLEQIMARIWPLDDRARAAALQAENGRLHAYVDTSWNVKARAE